MKNQKYNTIPLLKPVSLKIITENMIEQPLGYYEAKKIWRTKYLPLSSKIISMIKECNNLVEINGLDSEEFKTKIHALDLSLNRNSNKKYLTICENYEEVRDCVKDIVDSYKINNETAKNAE